MGTALIILFATEQTSVGKIISNKVFVGIGLLSYSAYLWHQPVFVFFKYFSIGEPDKITLVILIIIIFVFAYGSWRYIEQPFRSQNILSRKSIFVLSISFSLLIIVMGVLGIWHSKSSALNSQIFDMSTYEEQVKSCWGDLEKNPKIESACVLGDISKIPTFGLLGDSHAGSLMTMFDEEAKKLSLAGRNFSFRSCPPLSNALPLTSESSDLSCYEFRKDFFSVLEKTPNKIPNIIVVNARWALLAESIRYQNDEGGKESGGKWEWTFQNPEDLYQNTIRREIIDSISKIINAGKTVILIYPVPEMGWNIPRILAAYKVFDKEINASTGSVSYKNFSERNRNAYDILDAVPNNKNLIRIKPENFFATR